MPNLGARQAPQNPSLFKAYLKIQLSHYHELGREFGSILENQEIAVWAERLTREALNDHGNALATADAGSRKTVAT